MECKLAGLSVVVFISLLHTTLPQIRPPKLLPPRLDQRIPTPWTDRFGKETFFCRMQLTHHLDEKQGFAASSCRVLVY
uniref:Uncharacterized protein n=1 Tax=Rhodnius prolixus TaxID=13249 RepID=T1HM89_RHOPR